MEAQCQAKRSLQDISLQSLHQSAGRWECAIPGSHSTMRSLKLSLKDFHHVIGVRSKAKNHHPVMTTVILGFSWKQLYSRAYVYVGDGISHGGLDDAPSSRSFGQGYVHGEVLR